MTVPAVKSLGPPNFYNLKRSETLYTAFIIVGLGSLIKMVEVELYSTCNTFYFWSRPTSYINNISSNNIDSIILGGTSPTPRNHHHCRCT